MKNTLTPFFAAMLCLVMGSSAQITINDTHINTPGNSIVEVTDTTPDASIVPGSAGSGQFWDFSALAVERIDTIRFLTPAGLPGSAHFSGSNLAFAYESDDSSWTFLSNSTSELRVLGFSLIGMDGGVLDTVFADFELKILSYPSTLGTTFSDTPSPLELKEEFGFDPDGPGPHLTVDSLRFKSTLLTESNIDASGTLNNPYGSFDVLRQNATTLTYDSVFMYTGSSWSLISSTMQIFLGAPAVSTDTTYSYRWWTDFAGIGFPLVEFDVDGAGNIEGDVTWIKTMPVGIEEQADRMVSLYPNPTSGQLNITLDVRHSASHQLNVFDASGKQVKQVAFKGNQAQVQMGDLNNGLYIYQLLSNNGHQVAIGKISVWQ